MAEQFFKVRNTYLGIDGDGSLDDKHYFHKYPREDNSTVINEMDHSAHMIQSSHQKGANSFLTHHLSSDKKNQYEPVENNSLQHEHIEQSESKDKDSIYSIFDQVNPETKSLHSKIPVKSSMRDISNEKKPVYQNKTVSFFEGQNRLSTSLSQEEQKYSFRHNDEYMNPHQPGFSLNTASNRGTSPYERTMSDYVETKKRLMEKESVIFEQRKNKLEVLKRARELRNSSIEQSKIANSAINIDPENGYSPHIIDINHNTTGKIGNSPSITDIIIPPKTPILNSDLKCNDEHQDPTACPKRRLDYQDSPSQSSRSSHSSNSLPTSKSQTPVPNSRSRSRSRSRSASQPRSRSPTPLTPTDILKDPCALSFLKTHYPSTPKIPISHFAVRLTQNYLNILESFSVAEEEVVPVLEEKLENKGLLSLNKLQVMTSSKGLLEFISDICENLKRQKEYEENKKTQNEVFEQLQIVKEELEQKEQDLSVKEKELDEREEECSEWEEELKYRMEENQHVVEEGKNLLEDQAIRCQKEIEQKFKKQLKALEKKLESAQRDLRNKTQLIKQQKKLDTSVRYGGLNTSLRSSKGTNGDDPLAAAKKTIDKLKARISNLEKSYEVKKSKADTLEEQLEKEKKERNKFQENYYKIKTKKDSLEKDQKSYKERIAELEAKLNQANNKIAVLESHSMKPTNIQIPPSTLSKELELQDLKSGDDLDSFLSDTPMKGSPKEESRKLQSSKDQKSTPKKKAPLKASVKAKLSEPSQLRSVPEESNLFIEINTILLATLEMTLPLMISTPQTEKNTLEDTSMLSLTSNRKLEYSMYDENEPNEEKKTIKFGEMLFPAFNNLAPKLIEAIYVSKQVSESNRGIQGLADVTWSCLSFSFHSYVFPNLVKEVIDSQKYGKLAPNDLTMFNKAFEKGSSYEAKKFMPIRLDFKAKTSIFKRKVKAISSNVRYSDHVKHSRAEGISFPIYEVFNDIAVSDAVVVELLDLIQVKKTPSDNQENMINTATENSHSRLKSSKLKKSLQKPSGKEEADQHPVIKRKDKITPKMKVIACCLINILSSSPAPISKSLAILDNFYSNLPNEEVDNLMEIFLEINILPLLVLNLLNEQLLGSSLNILLELLTTDSYTDQICTLLLDPSLFEILKIISIKYSTNRSNFQEILIILHNINTVDPIRMKELCSVDYIEFLNNELVKESQVETEQDDEFLKDTLAQILNSLNE
ncbi:unnamed protein product [Moneuplotes crassus]|uniref:Uncharacterized protein n=1 Tax=Euplotes crassus TaxID=5936 RepID=A0AAD1ULD5_EUPCR|nr:unnamed protein product [Moneuplotes crassus]